MDSKKFVRVLHLRDVAWGPGEETGANVPGYSGGAAAVWLFRVWIFCSRGSLTPVAAPNVSPNVFLSRGVVFGFEKERSCTAFEGCGLRARCENRGQRTRLKWRLCRRVVVSGLDFL